MPTSPVIITTWNFGIPAATVGWQHLANNATALDAIELAANVTEDDPEVNSVGYGGLPNAEGEVELDAAIMDGKTHGAGAVAGLTRTMRPISIARKVMEHTPHVMLVGQNAVRFARQHGFEDKQLGTEYTEKRYQTWLQSNSSTEVAHFDLGPREGMKPAVPDDHDTIGLCALDSQGNLAVGCTTSGMAWKVPGRVGDSPIIGSGLYVDNEVGAAAATGHGDEMMKACVSFRVVMAMERGLTPQEACIEALRYLLKKRPTELHNYYGAAVIALRKDGAYGAAATYSGFRAPDRLWQWAVATSPITELHEGIYVTPDNIYPNLK